MKIEEIYDYIICGGGATGLLLANSLISDSFFHNKRVLPFISFGFLIPIISKIVGAISAKIPFYISLESEFTIIIGTGFTVCEVFWEPSLFFIFSQLPWSAIIIDV